MSSEVKIQRLTGAAVADILPALAQLRLEVFREYPYLYDGNLADEEIYLRTYAQSSKSVVVAVFEGDKLVGAATGMPMQDADEAVKAPFEVEGFDIDRIFYLGEALLEREYRGQGLGVKLIAECEAHAMALGGFGYTCFCAIERPADHPQRPGDYKPLDAFWQKRSYMKFSPLTTRFSWKELDEAVASEKTMVFWLKGLLTEESE